MMETVDTQELEQVEGGFVMAVVAGAIVAGIVYVECVKLGYAMAQMLECEN